MGANKQKQNIRVQKSLERQHSKKTYKELSPEQRKYIKAHEQFKQADKELNRFWRTTKRKDDGQVNWDALSEQEINCFEHIHKMSQRSMKTMNKLEESGVDPDKALHIFQQINTHSQSF